MFRTGTAGALPDTRSDRSHASARRREARQAVRPPPAGRLPRFGLSQYRADDPEQTLYFDEGRGDALVFLHGLGANLTHWKFVAPPLARSHRVIGLDMAGFGETRPLSGELTYEAMARHVFGLLDRLGVHRAILVGHSFGGAVATEMALREPARVRGLVLVSPAGFQRYVWWMKGGSRVLFNPWVLASTAVLSAPWVPGQVCRTRGPGVESFVRSLYRRSLPRPLRALRYLEQAVRTSHALRPELLNRSFHADFSRLTLPVHTVWGDEDRVLNVQEAAVNAQRLPAGRLSLLQGVGHMPIFERPDVVREAITDVRQRSRADTQTQPGRVHVRRAA